MLLCVSEALVLSLGEISMTADKVLKPGLTVLGPIIHAIAAGEKVLESLLHSSLYQVFDFTFRHFVDSVSQYAHHLLYISRFRDDDVA